MFELVGEATQSGNELAGLGDQRIDIAEGVLAEVSDARPQILQRPAEFPIAVGEALGQFVEIGERR